jgi:pectate lyase
MRFLLAVLFLFSASALAQDVTPPVISNLLPVSVPYSSTGTQTITLQATTNENATCRFHSSDVAYASMGSTFTGGGGTSHSSNITLENGLTFIRYVRCIDTTGNANATSEVLQFFIESSPSGEPPAFPGAGGGGAQSVGGRYGTICRVTNLNDSGAGSLRSCVEASGPRTVIFDVGGTIELLSALSISNPYITIAGQTAPGGGITLSGRLSTSDVINITTGHVIIRYLRVRKGYNAGTPEQHGDTINIRAGGHNVIVDSSSFSWSQDDGGVGSATTPRRPHKVTFSNVIIAEGLEGHSTSFITTSSSNLGQYVTDVDIHNSLLMNNSHRNPLIKSKTFRFVNNIVYNWMRYATQAGGGAQVDVIGNLYKSGPLKVGSAWPEIMEIQAYTDWECLPSQQVPGTLSLYVAGNIGYNNQNPDADNWPLMVREVTCENGTTVGVLDTQYKRLSQLSNLMYPINTASVSILESRVLSTVGASRRLDCSGNWVSNRDAVDTRLVSEYYAGTGIIPATEGDVGGYPTISAGTACTDSDGDGMPDEYETSKGLNPNSAADGSTVLANGYTNLEMFLAGPFQLSGLLPASGSQLAKSVTSAQIQVQTNSSSSCRWSNRPNVTWSGMVPYANTGGIAHSDTVDVVAGGVYQVCNRCYDGARLEYSQDSCTSFSVEANPKFMVW